MGGSEGGREGGKREERVWRRGKGRCAPCFVTTCLRNIGSQGALLPAEADRGRKIGNQSLGDVGHCHAYANLVS